MVLARAVPRLCLVEHLARDGVGEAAAAAPPAEQPVPERRLERGEQPAGSSSAARATTRQREFVPATAASSSVSRVAGGSAAARRGDDRAQAGSGPPAVGRQRAHELRDVEGVAARAFAQRSASLGRHRAPADRFGEPGDLVGVEPLELEVAEARPEPAERLLQRLVRRPVREQHEDRSLVQMARARCTQSRERRGVRPVDVLEHEQERPLGRGAVEDADAALEQPEARLLRVGPR